MASPAPANDDVIIWFVHLSARVCRPAQAVKRHVNAKEETSVQLTTPLHDNTL